MIGLRSIHRIALLGAFAVASAMSVGCAAGVTDSDTSVDEEEIRVGGSVRGDEGGGSSIIGNIERTQEISQTLTTNFGPSPDPWKTNGEANGPSPDPWTSKTAANASSSSGSNTGNNGSNANSGSGSNKP